jgi:hypothetical protein
MTLAAQKFPGNCFQMEILGEAGAGGVARVKGFSLVIGIPRARGYRLAAGTDRILACRCRAAATGLRPGPGLGRRHGFL